MSRTETDDVPAFQGHRRQAITAYRGRETSIGSVLFFLRDACRAGARFPFHSAACVRACARNYSTPGLTPLEIISEGLYGWPRNRCRYRSGSSERQFPRRPLSARLRRGHLKLGLSAFRVGGYFRFLERERLFIVSEVYSARHIAAFNATELKCAAEIV